MRYKNIVLHWTGGNYTPCSTDIEAYHYVIDGKGEVSAGKYRPEDNLECTDGVYAAHCGGGNTGRIGLAICCMRDSNTPPTAIQIEALCNLAAQMCFIYGLKPSDCITHAEFSPERKIDITEIPYKNLKGIKPCADYLRNKINWYLKAIKGV
jgi:N-acetyl-anhydromuramyl-L-alanine amidase AmpD